jgi:hypothetical protein
LEGGFWTDAVQSFTGGVVERIKLREGDMPENLFDIMLSSLCSGSSLCCIKKVGLWLPDQCLLFCFNFVVYLTTLFQ